MKNVSQYSQMLLLVLLLLICHIHIHHNHRDDDDDDRRDGVHRSHLIKTRTVSKIVRTKI
jgi:hypothetical protein